MAPEETGIIMITGTMVPMPILTGETTMAMTRMTVGDMTTMTGIIDRTSAQ